MGFYCQGLDDFGDEINTIGTAKEATHYQKAAMQPIEVMQAILSKEEFIGFLRGNIIKYRMRADYKDNKNEDINKANQYSHWLYLIAKNPDYKINPIEDIPPKAFTYEGI